MARILAGGLVLLGLSCGKADSGGDCAICPAYYTVDLGQCSIEGTSAHCSSATLEQVTDGKCGTGETTHTSCVFAGCDHPLDCTQIAR